MITQTHQTLCIALRNLPYRDDRLQRCIYPNKLFYEILTRVDQQLCWKIELDKINQLMEILSFTKFEVNCYQHSSFIKNFSQKSGDIIGEICQQLRLQFFYQTSMFIKNFSELTNITKRLKIFSAWGCNIQIQIMCRVDFISLQALYLEQNHIYSIVSLRKMYAPCLVQISIKGNNILQTDCFWHEISLNNLRQAIISSNYLNQKNNFTDLRHMIKFNSAKLQQIQCSENLTGDMHKLFFKKIPNLILSIS